MSKYTKENLRLLKKHIAYDMDTGIFVNKQTLKPYLSTSSDGYIKIRFQGSSYSAHRLAWAFFTGSWPEHEIDHINGIKVDNRIDNLRDVPHREHVAKRPALADKVCIRTSRKADSEWLEAKKEEAAKYFSLMRYFCNIPSV